MDNATACTWQEVRDYTADCPAAPDRRPRPPVSPTSGSVARDLTRLANFSRYTFHICAITLAKLHSGYGDVYPTRHHRAARLSTQIWRC
jgi:hypothetical protein